MMVSLGPVDCCIFSLLPPSQHLSLEDDNFSALTQAIEDLKIQEAQKAEEDRAQVDLETSRKRPHSSLSNHDMSPHDQHSQAVARSIWAAANVPGQTLVHFRRPRRRSRPTREPSHEPSFSYQPNWSFEPSSSHEPSQSGDNKPVFYFKHG